MKIHYFQRYHEKENVVTANTMLIIFNLQEKSVDSIPDSTITQESFKIVVETKMSNWFYEDQLLWHLNAFDDEKYKVMITLAPELMDDLFSSSSAAGAVLTGYNVSGPMNWKDASGKSLKEIEAEKMNEK